MATIGIIKRFAPLKTLIDQLRIQDIYFSNESIIRESFFRSYSLQFCIAIFVLFISQNIENFAIFVSGQGIILNNLIGIILPCYFYRNAK